MRRRDRTARPLRVVHYSSAVNTVDFAEPRARELPPARSYRDYAVQVGVEDLTRDVAVLDCI